ncbi:ubiquitin carboxyl-terminal hydrolase 25 isoform X2 [Trifolium pratense]|uniref:ubiquitin carboxyl-terminal hydrolase 25 isoform X2 n=1 Tax=Trifolium pratense TaxID=57577 RepID=UPI001E695BE2|nr:ubiquitin carboxyl-terminal hydrolase 25 isoform X2 [Trifolium pratense]
MATLQMTWQPNLLTPKRKTSPPLGLRNLGNSCYLNSVLQCLTFTPPLANFCLRSQHSSLCDSSGSSCPFCILEKQIFRLLRLDLTSEAPSKIQSCLRIFAEHFRCGRQEDAHEFLRYVIDACHNSCLRLKKIRKKSGGGGGGDGGASIVKEIFGGALQSQVKCLCCGYESNKVDEIMDISLDVFHSNSLKDSMQKFFQPEVLDGNNKYKCDGCKKLVTAKKQMSILQAPNILVIQLKRFEGILGGKIDKTVGFEEVMVLSSFMCKTSQDPQPEYKLFGTIVHSGYSPESGHYYAYIKDAMGRWYCCDDSCVTLASLQEVLSEKVYILFFSRTNQKPASVNGSLASNGVKPHHSNGSQASESPKVDVQFKAVHAKSNSEQSSRKDMPSVSKIGKVDMFSNQPLLTNGHATNSVSLENGKKDHSSSLPTRNGFDKNKIGVANNTKWNDSTVTNGHTNIQTVDTHSVKLDPPEDIDRSKIITVRGPGNFKQESNGVVNKTKILGNKRKVQEAPCILLANDSQSRARVEEMRDILGKEVKSVLSSCGWTDKVDEYMRVRKRLHEKEPGNLTSDVKRKLIADARNAFKSKVPESLKKDLIERLKSFSQEKVQFDGP